MSNLSVKHYLDIYETRLEMMQSGVTAPSVTVVAAVKKLVSELRRLDPEEGVHLDAKKDQSTFSRAATGELIAQIIFA